MFDLWGEGVRGREASVRNDGTRASAGAAGSAFSADARWPRRLAELMRAGPPSERRTHRVARKTMWRGRRAESGELAARSKAAAL